MASTTQLPKDPPAVNTPQDATQRDDRSGPGRQPERADRRDADPERARYSREDLFNIIPIVWDR